MSTTMKDESKPSSTLTEKIQLILKNRQGAQQNQLEQHKTSKLPDDSDRISGDEEAAAEKMFEQLSNGSEIHMEMQSDPHEQQHAQLHSHNEDKMIHKIKSILKSQNLADKLAQNRQQKSISFDLQSNEEYLINGSTRRWKEKLKNPKKGKFDPNQQKLLIKKLSQSMEEHNISSDELLQSLSEEKNEKLPKNLRFWAEIGSVLPDRTLISSYKFLKRKLSFKNNSGPWSKQQIELLMTLVEKHGRRWSKISREMNRTAENIRDKYRQLGEENNEDITKSIWKFQQLLLFLKLVQQYCKVDILDTSNTNSDIDIERELENKEEHDAAERDQIRHKKHNTKSFTFHNNKVVRQYINERFNSIVLENVRWKQISDKIGTKTIFECRNKFVQLMMIEARSSTAVNEKQLIEFVISQNVNSEAEINWLKWEEKHAGKTAEEARNRWMIIKKNVQGRGQKTFKQAVEALKEKAKITI